MNVLKFRAWFEKKPDWCNQMFYSDEESPGLGDWFSECEIESDHGNKVLFLQFVGLKDKNGAEIYAGDILKDDVGDIGIVRFGKLPLNKSGDCVCTYGAFYVECKGQLGQSPSYDCTEIGDWMEVIGNHFENLELLHAAS
ncbi:MAG: hypothetical protein E3J60_04530 [Dehalococcoidia bacterium]|nr:MAG: hypothetical protein E3J60_04530 [Dehalococcoidia bacterium]